MFFIFKEALTSRLICAISLCQNLSAFKIRRCCYPVATTTYQFGISFSLIIDDVTEEVIGHLIETGNLDQLYQLGSCARGHPQEQSGLDFLVV